MGFLSLLFGVSVFGNVALAHFPLFPALNARQNMEGEVTTFVQSLELATTAATTLSSELKANTTVNALLKGQPYDSTIIVTIACKALQLAIGASKVDIKPVDPAEVQINWSQTCWKAPTCAIIPTSAKDVSKILKVINFLRVKFAVRSGGHSPNPGFSSINEPGILIDLQKLNSVTVSADKKVASLGPSGRWGDVYAALDPFGVSVIGGRIPQVGVAGLILGGGFFHFSGEYGLAADNVKNFEIVLADGTITNANTGQNSDLFWALKGGGPNFGIVTKFDLYTVPVHDIWYQVGAYSVDQAHTLIDAFAKWQVTGASDLKATVAFIITLDVITVGLIYSAPATKPKAFEVFYGIPPLQLAVPPTNGTVHTLTQILASISSSEPMRHDYRGVSTKINAQLYKDVYEFWKVQASAVRAATGANMTFVLQPVTSKVAAAGAAKGGNPMGIPAENQQWWTTLVDWRNPADDAKVRAAPIATTKKWVELSKARGLHIPYIFMNDASRDQNPLSSYGAANLQRLKTVAAKYDRSQVFQKLQQDGFLLSKA